MGFLGNAYLWVKAGHVIFVIFWMAGLFMLPRYLVYHQEGLGDPVDAATRWADAGAEFLHVVDLDGAKAGEPRNLEAIRRIADKDHRRVSDVVRDAINRYLEAS